MSQFEKLLLSVMIGTKDNAMLFNDICKLLELFGFSSRIKGGHHIFYKEGVSEIINIQSNGKYAKPYQVKQIRRLIEKYKIGGDINV